MELLIRRFVVFGKVQGVYFRHSTRIEAERLAILGRARNLSDGSVEVIAQGSQVAVEHLLEWLHRGPSLARVESVRELEVTPEHAAVVLPGGANEQGGATGFYIE